MDRDAIHLTGEFKDESGSETKGRWTFSLTDLPDAFVLGAAERDEPHIVAHRLLVKLEGTHWLPLSALLSDGCFRRMQDIRDLLTRQTRPDSFYCFLSHRWLTPTHPDPEARQAQFFAWQLVAHLAEAVRVARQRGLHQARRFSTQLGQPVGPRGSDLSEALIVNLLRLALDDELLNDAAAEALSLEADLEDYGVARASRDTGLIELNRLLADLPVLRALTDRIYVWYDYSCLPQPPREGADGALFVKGLEELSPAQILGRTIIMLDDADDYLSRAWCTLEALTADTLGGSTDLIVGSARPSAAHGEVEHFFEQLIADRPHVLWRAVLDTELFRIQSFETCMSRLGLAVTDRNDLPFIYKRLKGLNAPAKIHIDDSEVVTGVVPLPAFENGSIILRARRAGRSIIRDAEPPQTATLNWTGALSLASALNDDVDPTAVKPFRTFPEDGASHSPSCHVAVVGACEGEAILLASWVEHHRAELEARLSVTVRSMSWVATDVAPVGHIEVGSLQVAPVVADRWIIVATSMRLLHCKVTGLIAESLRWSFLPYATVALDRPADNVEIQQPVKPPGSVKLEELIVAVNVAQDPPRSHPGGLFQWQIQDELL